jgi:hypothetical protein
MVGVSRYYDKKAALKDLYLYYFYGAKIGALPEILVGFTQGFPNDQ